MAFAVTRIPPCGGSKHLHALLQVKKQMVLDETTIVATTFESLSVNSHEFLHESVHFWNILNLQLTSLQERVNEQNEFKALHKLIHFLGSRSANSFKIDFPFFDNNATTVHRIIPGQSLPFFLQELRISDVNRSLGKRLSD